MANILRWLFLRKCREKIIRLMSKLKAKIDEFAAIATSLPENLQLICFELLLRNFLEGPKHATDDPRVTPMGGPAQPPPPPPEPATPTAGEIKQHDLKESHLHVKVRKFLQKHSLSIEQLNNLYFKENNDLKPLYEDLKTTKASESQIRITLLNAFQNAISTGDFEVSIESVRNECKERKCYDLNHFTGIFSNNKSLFDFKEFTKNTDSVRLSEEGKKKLAEIIKELQ